MCSNDVQFWNAPTPMDVVELALTDVSDEHPLKASEPIVVKPDFDGKTERREHPSKALLPMVVIVFGKET